MLGDHRGGPGMVGRPSGRSGTGWETFLEVLDELGDPRGVRDWWGTLGEVRDGSGNFRRGPG